MYEKASMFFGVAAGVFFVLMFVFGIVDSTLKSQYTKRCVGSDTALEDCIKRKKLADMFWTISTVCAGLALLNALILGGILLVDRYKQREQPLY